MMKSPYDIIRRPIITERSMEGVEDGKYVFEVDRRAGKAEIRKAIEAIFSVQVAKVNTMMVPGKKKRVGAFTGKTPTRKKAIVTLKEGSKPIEIFEGMI